jgi:heat shock protein beta
LHRTYSFFERIDRALRRSLGVSETAQAPSNVDPAPPVATGEPEADPEAILRSEEFVDWQDMKKHLADPDLEKVFDKTPDEDEPEPPKHDRVEKETGYQTPSTTSAAPEATATAAHDEL